MCQTICRLVLDDFTAHRRAIQPRSVFVGDWCIRITLSQQFLKAVVWLLGFILGWFEFPFH